MFDAPPSTLYSSLNKLLDSPKEFLADVCFTFSTRKEIWAHRAIILSRAPKEFISKYAAELLVNDGGATCTIDLSHAVSQDLFSHMLRFWYTASFSNFPSTQSSISEIVLMTPVHPSLKDNITATNNLSLQTPPVFDIRHEIEQKCIELGTPLLPKHSPEDSDYELLVKDLKRMRDENLATDVSIDLVSANNDSDYFSHKDLTAPVIPSLLSTSPDNFVHKINTETTVATFRAHRFILAAQSSYFYALFCAQFQEASSAVVHLTNDLFNQAIIDVMLNFFYTDRISVEPLAHDTAKASSPLQRKLQHNKHALRVIQKAFYAADYLGHSETLGQALLFEMEKLCHNFKCVCPNCAVLLPAMLAWSDKHKTVVPELQRTLILLYSDPIHSLAPLWSQRPFALLITFLVPSAAMLGESTYQAVLKQEPLFRARTPKTLVHEIEERTFYNVTKHNAIHALHSLHLCLSQIRSADPFPSWSRPALDLIKPILTYAVNMVSRFFDFYCVEYPILLSCVDGIGAGFSVDFLDFVLSHVLTEGIQDTNAGTIYQGIVRDLIGRQEVIKNMAIDDVLIKSRNRCAAYIAKNWAQVKTHDGFQTLEKNTLRLLSEDTGILYRSLAKPFETDFSNIFSFKPKKSKKNFTNNNNSSQYNKNALLAEAYTRRLSLGNLMTRSFTTHPTTSTLDTHTSTRNRPRALSTESALIPNLIRFTPEQTTNRENQPLINLLSYESEERRARMNNKDNIGLGSQHSLVSDTVSIEHCRPMLRTSSSFTSLTDQLLPVDNLISPTIIASHSGTVERSSRLRFELPATPSRSKSPIPKPNNSSNVISQVAMSAYLSPQAMKTRSKKGSKSIRKGRWSIGSNSDASDDEQTLPVLGDKVELLRRPLPTMGIIKYIGPVQFAEGPYIGIELESRLGKSDGSIDGVRYFRTDPQRALFVKSGDFRILVSNANHHHNSNNHHHR